MILLVSHEGDDHLVPVQSALDRMGTRWVAVDTAQIPTRIALTAEHGAADRWRLVLGDREVDLADCGAGWWRRPLPHQLDPRVSDPAEATFAATETYEAATGFWDALPLTWVSPPKVVETTMMKTWQLPAARAAGLQVPRTMVTNNALHAREFIDSVGDGKVVCKAFSAQVERWRETRMVGPEQLAVLDRVALAPVIFQEFVPAEVDLRVTVVGEQVFTAAIHSQEVPYALDFRLHLDEVRMEPTTLPAETEEALLRFLKAAGLRYGAVDFRRTPGGEHVFLEVNPAGQWLFVEERSGLPITAAMAELLTTLDQA
jgi:RimK-like ATP-grasp domain